MAKSDIRLIIQGGALCAAFSFMALFVPILGAVVNYFALLPIFYVGICLGIRSYLLAISIPLIGFIILLGPIGLGIFSVTILAPSLAILYWHFLKKKNSYVFSPTDILHLLSSRFLGLITIGFCYIKLSNSHIFELLAQKIETINTVAKIPSSPNFLIDILPGMFSFLWLLMVWLNFQIAYSLALKSNKSIRKPSLKQNIFLLPVWDIAFVASLWLIITNQLLINSPILGIFSRTALCISAFPLLIDGIEIIQLMAKAYKLPSYSIVIFMSLTFLLVWPMIFVVLLGLVEPLYGLKKKYYSKFN
jgi:hypothetical protein